MVDDSGCEVSPLHIRRWEAVGQNSTTSSDERASTQENIVAAAMAVPPTIKTNIDSLNIDQAIETRRSSIHDRHNPRVNNTKKATATFSVHGDLTMT
jgi:hypothetical protein